MRIPSEVISASLLLAVVSNAACDFAVAFHLAPLRSKSSWHSNAATRKSTTMIMSSSDDAPKKIVLKAADLLAKANMGGSLSSTDKEDEVPKLFSEDIYNDFQSALLKLEKRVKEGAGSLGKDEVRELDKETARIVEEMNAFLKDPEGKKNEIAVGYAAGGRGKKRILLCCL